MASDESQSSTTPIDWEQKYIEGETHWDRGQVSPPLMQYITTHPLLGRVLVPGCGRGNDVAALARAGVDVTGLDIAPTAVREAKERYPEAADRFIAGDLFNLAPELRGAFDVVVEHTCLSGMSPDLRENYRLGRVGIEAGRSARWHLVYQSRSGPRMRGTALSAERGGAGPPLWRRLRGHRGLRA
jgi:SAM-dependent methyltransferase